MAARYKPGHDMSTNAFPNDSSQSSPKTSRKKPRPHAEWLKLIAEWQTSGLDEGDYCQSIGVKLDTFRQHRYRANKAARADVQPSGFQAVEVISNSLPLTPGIVLHTTHCRIEFPLGAPVQDVAGLVKALEA